VSDAFDVSDVSDVSDIVFRRGTLQHPGSNPAARKIFCLTFLFHLSFSLIQLKVMNSNDTATL